jgi:predicted Zn-dependent protease
VPAFLSTLGRLDEAAGDRRGVPNWLSTHPDPLSRVEDIQPVVAQLKSSGTSFTTNRDALWQRIDGMIYGDSPEQGFVRDNVFLHPVLRFRIEFPDKWEVANSPQQVVAKAPGADVFMLLQGVQKPQGRDIREIAFNDMSQAGFRAVDGGRTTINGLDAFVGVYQGQMEGLGPVVARVAHIVHGKDIYLVAGIVAPNAFQQADRAFQGSIRTFRPLAAAEAENIRPDRVDLYVVRAGDTWQSISERSGGAVKPATLAVMNNASPGSQPQPGARIKIVVRG